MGMERSDCFTTVRGWLFRNRGNWERAKLVIPNITMRQQYIVDREKAQKVQFSTVSNFLYCIDTIGSNVIR